MGNITAVKFNQLMQTIADGWNEGDALKAVDCFSDDAIYTEPPDKQVYRGRAELFEFFGGDKGTDVPMKMTWHHLAFNEETQVGFGEYTFQMHGKYHGIVIVKLENGLVRFWREYQYKTGLDWEQFSRLNSF